MTIMAYSLDLCKRVLDFVETGGKKSEASRRFSVSRSTLYRWLADETPLTPQKTGPKKMRVIDEEALRKHVADFPDLPKKSVPNISVFQRLVSDMDCENSVSHEKKKKQAISNVVIRSEQLIAKNSNAKKPRVNLLSM